MSPSDGTVQVRRGPGRPRKQQRTQQANNANTTTTPTLQQWLPRENPLVPGAVQAENNFQVAVLAMQDFYRADNTKEAYKNKGNEFIEYCNTVFDAGPTQFSLYSRKVFDFMFYQMMHPKKKVGGYKSGRGGKFNLTEYKEVMAKHANWLANPSGPPETPIDPVGESTFVHYMMAIKGVWQEHRARGICTWRWEDIWELSLHNLHNVVKTRKAKLSKDNYNEKVDSEFAPYQIVEDVEKIEEELWKHGRQNSRQAFSWLRHRFCFLYTTRGILRAESVFNGELSDLAGLTFKKPQDPHALEICVIQLPQGKTNKGLKLYGRCLRSKDVLQCGFGALSFYLAYRFDYTGEFKDKETNSWMDNPSWFDIKLLVDGTRSDADFEKAMANTTYAKAIKKVLSDLGIASNHWVHIGRVLGSKILEMLEAESEGIRQLGNWNPFMQEKCYSAKLPLGPMRSAAGYVTGNGMYYNPRSTCQPSESLMKLTPFGWAFDAHERLMQLMRDKDLDDAEDQRFPATAFAFLRMMMLLAKILLQDAAAIEIEHPERKEHPLYRLNVFQTQQYKDFVLEMRTVLDSCRLSNVMDHTVESVLPGVHTKIAAVHENVDLCRQENKRAFRKLGIELKDSFREEAQKQNKVIADALRGMSDAFDTASSPTTTRRAARQLEATGDEGVDASSNVDCEENLLFLRSKYCSINDIWKDWKGVGGSALAEAGGVELLETTKKREWRTHWDTGKKTQFSRFKAIVAAIVKKSEEPGSSIGRAISELDTIYKSDDVKVSLGNMNKWVKDNGLVPKKRNRGR